MKKETQILNMGYLIFINIVFYTSIFTSIILYQFLNGGQYSFILLLVISFLICYLLQEKIIRFSKKITKGSLPTRIISTTILVTLFIYPIVGSAYSLIYYDREDYNCTHMSIDQLELMESLGIKA